MIPQNVIEYCSRMAVDESQSSWFIIHERWFSQRICMLCTRNCCILRLFNSASGRSLAVTVPSNRDLARSTVTSLWWCSIFRLDDTETADLCNRQRWKNRSISYMNHETVCELVFVRVREY